MISVQNRTPTPGKEGRVSIAQDNGNVIEGILTMADGATDPGTPWNRNTANHLQAIRKTLPVAAGQTIAAGDVVDVVSIEQTFGDLPVGSTVQLKENGVLIDYIVVNQGVPSGMYDGSCDGTWLLRSKAPEKRAFSANNLNDYANSDINTWLNGDFLTRFSQAAQDAIKSVKIPYRPGSETSTSVNSGANGLSVKAFLLGAYEVGFTTYGGASLVKDGDRLTYFLDGMSTEANNKRTFFLYDGSQMVWNLRTPKTTDSNNIMQVAPSGYLSSNICSAAYGVLPCIIMPKDVSAVTFIPPTHKEEITKSSSSSQAIALQPGTAGQNIDVILSGVAELPGITAGTEITSTGVYGYCPVDGWVDVVSEWATNAGVQIAHGEYIGTGTYGSANPTKIILPFVPQLLIVFDKVDGGGGFPWVRGVPYGKAFNINADIPIVWSAETTSFYSSQGADAQFNTNNRPYVFFAIGGGK